MPPRWRFEQEVVRRRVKVLRGGRQKFLLVVRHPFYLVEDRCSDRINGGQGRRPEIQATTPCPIRGNSTYSISGSTDGGGGQEEEVGDLSGLAIQAHKEVGVQVLVPG